MVCVRNMSNTMQEILNRFSNTLSEAKLEPAFEGELCYVLYALTSYLGTLHDELSVAASALEKANETNTILLDYCKRMERYVKMQ